MTTSLDEQARPAVSKLIEADEEQLFQELGIRLRAIEQSPEISGSFDPTLVYSAVAMGPLDAVGQLGRRIYRRWEREAHEMVCGSQSVDSEERNALLDAFGSDGTAVAAIIAGALVSQFGLAPAIAAVIATIVIKRFFRPAYDEFCTAWSERLAQAQS